jgi:SAM-dependent methyltransferase
MLDYDVIATEYTRHRKVHPEALRGLLSTSGVGSASKVLEVGCGIGNYVIAGKVSFQLGKAEKLDFPRDFFDLVFSVDVIHHMSDYRAYFREAYRVLRLGGKVCTVTDSEWIIRHRQPLAIYFPETVQVELGRYPRIARLREVMEGVGFGKITETNVEFPYELTDIQAYRDKVFSSLHLIPEEAFRRGIERMERDLRTGPIPCVSRYLLLWATK